MRRKDVIDRLLKMRENYDPHMGADHEALTVAIADVILASTKTEAPSPLQESIAGPLKNTFGNATNAVNRPHEMIDKIELNNLREGVLAVQVPTEKQKVIAIMSVIALDKNPGESMGSIVTGCSLMYDYVIANVK